MGQIDFDDESVRDAFVAIHLRAIETVRWWFPLVLGRGDQWERDLNDLDGARRQLADAWAHEDADAFDIARGDIASILSDLLGPDDMA